MKDYGTGIAAKDFHWIFRPFKQANSFTEQLYGGTGLGLAITSKLVRGLGGHIGVDSIKGEWSEITIDFPFDPANPDETEKAGNGAPLSGEVETSTKLTSKSSAAVLEK